MRWQFGITCVAFDAGISRPEDCSRSYIAWPKHGNTSDHHHGILDGHVVLPGKFFFKQWASMVPICAYDWNDILCIIPNVSNSTSDGSMKSIPLEACHDHKDFF